jgi:hypothetical protein
MLIKAVHVEGIGPPRRRSKDSAQASMSWPPPTKSANQRCSARAGAPAR